MSGFTFSPRVVTGPELSLGQLMSYADLRQRFFGEDRNTALVHADSIKPGPGQTADEAYAIACRSLLAVDAANAKWIAL